MLVFSSSSVLLKSSFSSYSLEIVLDFVFIWSFKLSIYGSNLSNSFSNLLACGKKVTSSSGDGIGTLNVTEGNNGIIKMDGKPDEVIDAYIKETT